MTTITTSTDAVTHIETLLGSDGSHALARRIVESLGWRDIAARVERMSETEWNSVLDAAQAVIDLRGELLARLSSYDDGDDTLGVIVDTAIADGTADASRLAESVAAVRAIIEEAIADARMEAAAEVAEA